MKVKVSEATNLQLDWMVATALGYNLKIRNWEYITAALDPVEDADLIALHKERNTVRVSAEQIPGGGWFPNRTYSTDWSQGGPIIEREDICILDPNSNQNRNGQWHANCGAWAADGPTPLIAAMRAYVASRLGLEVEVPEELG